MSNEIRVVKGSDGKYYPYTSPDIVVDSTGESQTTKNNSMKTDINNIKTDLGTEELFTGKSIKQSINEVNAQYKDIMSQLKDMLERIGLLENYHKPKLYDLPRFNMVGDISNMSKTNPKTLDIELLDVYGTPIFNNKKATVKWQGDSSLSHPKKNYAIKMFENDGTTKFKYKFFDDVKANDGYHLKAEYQDSSTHARNTVLARLTKSAYKNPLAARCCIDSFPIEIYINGEYQGLYNWNLKQHKSVYGLDDANPNHLMYRASSNETLPTPCNFRALSTNNEEDVPSDWEDRFPETNTAENRAKLNRLITFIKDSDDATFKANFEQYMNLEYTLIYRISCQVFNMVDSLAKNMNILTYDGNIWYPTFYDMDSTLGISWGMLFNSGAKLQPTNEYPTGYGCSNSLLWEKFDRCFAEEIKQRYAELRTGVYAYDNIINQLQTYINLIPQSCFDRDWAKWTACPHEGYGLDYIKTFMTSRLKYVDGLMTSTTPSEPSKPSEQGVIQLTDDMTSVDLNGTILTGNTLWQDGQPSAASVSQCSTTYLDVSNLSKFNIYVNGAEDIVICSYDNNKKFISRAPYIGVYTVEINRESNVKYIRVAVNGSFLGGYIFTKNMHFSPLKDYQHQGTLTNSTTLNMQYNGNNYAVVNYPLVIGKTYTIILDSTCNKCRIGTNNTRIPITGKAAISTLNKELIDDNTLKSYTFTAQEGDNYLFGFFKTDSQVSNECFIINESSENLVDMKITTNTNNISLIPTTIINRKLNDTGNLAVVSGSVSSSSYLDISELGNTTLSIYIPDATSVVVCAYNANKQFVNRISNTNTNNANITLDSSFKYIRLMINTQTPSIGSLHYVGIDTSSSTHLYKYAHNGTMTSSTILNELNVTNANTCYINIPLQIGKSYTVKTNGNNDRFRLGTNDTVISADTATATIKRGLVDDNTLDEYTFTTTEGDNYLFGFFTTNDNNMGGKLPRLCLILNN